MSEYNGPAELLADDGIVIAEVNVHILKYLEGGLRSWSGHVQPGEFEGAEWMNATRIRLEDGSEGDIVMTNDGTTATAFGTVRTAQFQGSGPAPF